MATECKQSDTKPQLALLDSKSVYTLQQWHVNAQSSINEHLHNRGKTPLEQTPKLSPCSAQAPKEAFTHGTGRSDAYQHVKRSRRNINVKQFVHLQGVP